jgi:hypothetical protein
VSEKQIFVEGIESADTLQHIRLLDEELDSFHFPLNQVRKITEGTSGLSEWFEKENNVASCESSETTSLYNEVFGKILEQESDTKSFNEGVDEVTFHHKPIFRIHLINSINNANFEYGFKSEVDDYLIGAFQKYGELSRQWLAEIFLDEFNNPFRICGILRTIGNFEYHDLKPQGMIMAIAACSHEDFEVKECGIRCFENWEEPEALKYLRHISLQGDWLNEYLSEVIDYLEELKPHATAC